MGQYKHKKQKTDAQKGKIFTKIGREIAIVVKQGGPDPEVNSKLKDVIAKAKAANMPNETIMRSIKKAAGKSIPPIMKKWCMKAMAPAVWPFIVEATTDNRNRTAGEVRHLFDKFGGNLGTTGCVSFMFDKKGVILIEKATKLMKMTL